MNWHLKYFFSLGLLLAMCMSCRPYKSTTIKPGQMTYYIYRENQETFFSEEGAIKYIDKGVGDVIVLLHGVPTSGWLYRHMIDELSKSHRVIVPDMLGFGSSDSPEGYEIYSEEKHADRLLALMSKLKIEKWTHVLHDAGGLWTWELIKKAPEKLESLVVLNTIIYEDGFKPPIRFKPGFMAKTAMWGYRNGITTNMMLNGLFKFGLTENNLSKADVEGYKRPLKEGKTRGMYYFFSKTCNELPNYQKTLLSVDAPVLLIWGKSDEFLLWETQKEDVMNDLNIFDKNVHLIDAKHFIQEEKPQLINELILDFLSDVKNEKLLVD